jgi:hypothetical protein
MLFQIISCFIIGRYFSQLAFDSKKNRWGTGVLAAVCTFVLQIILAVIIQIILSGLTTTGFAAAIIASFAAIGLSGLIMFLVYKYFEKSWAEPKTKLDSNLLDEDGYMKN